MTAARLTGMILPDRRQGRIPFARMIVERDPGWLAQPDLQCVSDRVGYPERTVLTGIHCFGQHTITRTHSA